MRIKSYTTKRNPGDKVFIFRNNRITVAYIQSISGVHFSWKEESKSWDVVENYSLNTKENGFIGYYNDERVFSKKSDIVKSLSA